MVTRSASTLFAFALLLVSGGCVVTGGSGGNQANGTSAQSVPSTATAILNPTEGNNVHGNVIFTQVKGGIRVQATLTGLTPGEHGFHIHENGDCSAPDGSSAGGHFNPDGMEHAGPDAESRHEGDLGIVVANDAGEATYDRVDSHLSLAEGPHSIIGRGVVVHGGADDFTSQPSGNAGPRVACGVIEAATH